MIKHRTIASAFVLVLCLFLSSCGLFRSAASSDTNEKTESTEPDESKKKGAKPEKEYGNDPSSLESSNIESSSIDSPGLDAAASIPLYQPERVDTDDLTWEFDDQSGTLFIHGQGPMRDYSQNYPDWEQYADSIIKVVLDEGITSVGACAFFGYSNLAEVILPDSIEVVDTYAFYYAWELRTISIPASLKYVGDGAFYNTLIWEPQDLVFPEGCEYIGDNAFHSALKTEGIVSLPSTLSYLGSCAFTNACISDFIIQENNSTYCVLDHAIFTKDMLNMLMLAPFATLEKNYCVPEGVECIYPECFNLIRGVESIFIPASVKEIPEQTFFGNYDLNEIIVDEENAYFRSLNGILLSKDGTLLLAWPDGMELEEIVIPDGVERVGMNLFYGRFDKSYSVVLPEGVKEIGSFSLPSIMSDLSLPASLEKIEDNVFYNGMTIDNIFYQGTGDNWNRIDIGQGNEYLENVSIQTK